MQQRTATADRVATLPMDEPQQTAMVPTAPSTKQQSLAAFVDVIERLAANPDVDVVKLEKIIELQERIIHHNAKAAFDADFAKMAPQIPEIDEKGKILVKGTLRSTYAKLEDIHEVVKPIIAKYGFAIRHRTEWPADRQGTIRIVGILSHEQGHSEESVFEAPMDRSEYRTDIQSMGSTVSYGRRYTTLDLLNIATRGQDNDGRTAGRPQPPDGYDKWIEGLEAESTSGVKAYERTWQQSPPECKTFCANHDKDRWNAIKAAAVAADEKGRRR